jgi:SAM-dependent methyltransferase
MVDFEHHRWRSRFEAWLLDGSAEATHESQGERKSAEIGSMSGTIVELGPGTGVNMRYYAPGVHVIAMEPNPVMHDRLRRHAAEHDVDIEIRTLAGESLDVADGEADGVVGTLLLCGVEDPAKVIAEAHRILKPGGRYFFTEHVRAPDSTWTRRIQRVLRRPHGWMFNGCRTDQDTAAILRDSPFETVDIDEEDRGPRGLYVRHGLIGTAVKSAQFVSR